MRLDRLITLGLTNPIRRVLAHLPSGSNASRSTPVLPVLMYHSVSDTTETGLTPYYQVCTTPGRFADHMQWLEEAGWRGVTLSEGLEWLEERKRAGSGQQSAVSSDGEIPTSAHRSPVIAHLKPVAITFDDGFRDFHTAAFPILQRHGFAATMYLPTAFIGTDRRSFKSHECLTWAEVRELAASGMEFGSHTINHPKLVELDWTEIETELRDSRATIEQRLGKTVQSFAYPYAFPPQASDFVHRFRALLDQTGYESCATTAVGRVRADSDRLQLPRLPANSADDSSLLNAKLNGAYDWLRVPQQAVKTLKRARGKTPVSPQTTRL